MRSEKNDSSDVEQVYKKMTQIEHILQRPDTYVGSIESDSNKLWVLEQDMGSMKQRMLNYVPGLYKIFDEILVNAADNYQRDPSMNRINVSLDKQAKMISVWNNGRGIPVQIHAKFGIYVPELIFGHLLTSSNYNDDQKKVTGGRNGYGAKLANVFSNRFIVETADSQRMLKFKMEWTGNMSDHSEPQITKLKKKEDFTCVSFYPDLTRFGMQEFDDDFVSLVTKRVYELAGCTGRKVQTYFNNTLIPVKTFQDYVQLFKPKTQPMYFSPNSRWEVAVTTSEEGLFQQVSFVNGISTTKGGTHVAHVTDQLVNALAAILQKRHKDLKIKNPQIKQHLWVFVNCLIENPRFDSQTKENMTLKSSAFGSQCELSPKFLKDFTNSGVIDNIIALAKAKNDMKLRKQVKTKKNEKLQIDKLEDANKAGSREGKECTLILTEGDSAKALAMSGLEVLGRDYYGVFPLKGKLLNVRDATHTQLQSNKEFQNLMKIIGLVPKKQYKDTSELRYGSIMIMADQDLDGSHIKGLLINMIDCYFPSLIRLDGFIKEFITPILKAFKGSEILSFFSIPDYEHWKAQQDRSSWRIKYYKGLGTSSSKEGKEYFSNIDRHQIDFVWTQESADAIDKAFNKKRADDRKQWLANYDPNYQIDFTVKTVSFNNFIDKELIMFSNHDNIRSIPSGVDGLKPGQRKIIYASFKRNSNPETRVSQLASAVAERTIYHHGEQSLVTTIVGLAQNYCGSNNVNLLLPIGQFGTRNTGGKDYASARYINTKLSNVARYLFVKDDDALLEEQYDEGHKIEPTYFVPIIPLVLVNGAEGIGTGWSTNVPQYNPIEIIDIYVRRLESSSFDEIRLTPWYKGYTGCIEPSTNGFEVKAKFERLDADKIRVTELPLKKWTADYKRSLIELTMGEDPFITSFTENHPEDRIDFEITSPKFSSLSDEEILKTLKLTGSISLNNLVLHNPNRQLKRYANVQEIIEEHFVVRELFYNKRKDYLVRQLEKRNTMISSKVRFILEIIEGTLVVRNRQQASLVNELHTKNYPTQRMLDSICPEIDEQKVSSESESGLEYVDSVVPVKEYKYLLLMPLFSLTLERVKALEAEAEKCRTELEKVQNTHIYEMWKEDLELLRDSIQQHWYSEESDRKNVPKPRGKKPAAAIKKQRAPPKKRGTNSKPAVSFKTESDEEEGSLAALLKKNNIKLNSDSSDGISSDTNGLLVGRNTRNPQAKDKSKRPKKPLTEIPESDSEFTSN